MKRKKTHIYATDKTETFLELDSKKYIGIFAILLIYLLACLIAFIEYIINGVDFIHILTSIILLAGGVVPTWILGEGYLLSKQAIKVERKLADITQGVISWKRFARLYGDKNAIRSLDRMIRRGYLTGIRIHTKKKAIILEENYRQERSDR